jgi:hypothetical protein
MSDMKRLMERWRRAITEDDENTMNEIAPALATAARVAAKTGKVADKVGKVAGAVKTGADVVKKVLPDDDDDEAVEEHKAEDDADYPSRKEKRRKRMMGNPNKHASSWVAGMEDLQSLSRGIAEDIVNSDTLEVDIATLSAVVRDELNKAFQQIQKKSGGGCSFDDLVRATRAWSFAQKAKPPS